MVIMTVNKHCYGIRRYRTHVYWYSSESYNEEANSDQKKYRSFNEERTIFHVTLTIGCTSQTLLLKDYLIFVRSCLNVLPIIVLLGTDLIFSKQNQHNKQPYYLLL